MAIYDVPPTREEWLRLRQDYVGGSESACLFGAQASYQPGAYELFFVKAKKISAKEVDAEIVEAGNFMEPAIANWACHRYGWQQRPAVFAVDDHVKVEINGTIKGMAGTLDRIVMPSKQDFLEGFAGPGVLECKNVSVAQVSRAWADDAEPPHVQIQLQHNMACSGFSWGAIAMLDGGNRLVVNKYHARPTMHAAIRAKVKEFWERVRDNIPYPVDGLDGTARALAALYPTPDEPPLEFGEDAEIAKLCEAERELCIRMKEDDEEVKRIRNLLRERLGNHQKGFVTGPRSYRITNVINPGTADRPAREGEIIKGRGPSVWAKITEVKPKDEKASNSNSKKMVAV
jgi:predicted phage-related endonuclease